MIRLLPILLLCGCAPSSSYTYNVGAECTITSVTMDSLPRTLTTQEMGDFRIDENGKCSIRVVGKLDTAAFTLLHEYEHFIEEDALKDDPVALRKVRHAFLQLHSPEFQIGNDDLLTELP